MAESSCIGGSDTLMANLDHTSSQDPLTGMSINADACGVQLQDGMRSSTAPAH